MLNYQRYRKTTMAKLPDTSKLTAKEIQALEAMLAKAGTSIAALANKSPLADPAYKAKCLALRPEFEKLAQEKGVTLAHIFTATDKVPTTFKDPATGAVYLGRGKKPAWLVGKETEYEVRTNGQG
jgi:hypothetical protein